MKKTAAVLIVCFLGMFVFCVFSQAAQSTQEEIWYADVWDAIDGNTKKMLSDIGISSVSADDFLNIKAENVFSVLTGIFKGNLATPLASSFTVLAVILTVSFVCGFFPDGKMKELSENIAMLVIIFILIAVSFDVIKASVSAIELSKDFILSLIPILCAVVAFSGNPTLALNFNSIVFSFAQGISVLFANIIPPFAGVGCAFSAASAINPMMKFSRLADLIFKAASIMMAFVSGIFVSVLSIRGVIAGAADTVTIKGLRFLIGNSVPVVGSAIADALNSVVAGVGLARNTIGILGIVVCVLINLPVICQIVVWKLSFYVLSICCDILSKDKISSFLETLNSVLSVITAVLCFNMFIYIISIAIIFTIKAG